MLRAGTTLLAAFAALNTVSARPSSTYVLHETRSDLHHSSSSKWKRGMRVDGDAIVPLRIGLTQTNLHTGYDRLMEVSHPSSASFGKHLSPAEVADLFAPADEAVDAVKAWLVQSGVDASRILHYENKGWLAVDLPVRELEALFLAQYHEVEYKGTMRIGADQYHVPAHLAEHIDYITPGVKLSAPMKKRSIKKRSGARKGAVGVKQAPVGAAPAAAAGLLPADLQTCATDMTAVCYRAMYGIPTPTKAVAGQQVGLVEDGDSYSEEDVDAFFSRYAPWVPNGTYPKLESIDGGVAPVAPDSEENGGESDIDIDIITSLVYPQTITLYQTDDDVEYTDGFLNTFLDALDGSYCNYTAYGITGDSPGVDPTYPDPLPGGYKGALMCGTYKPTNVVSISYGEAEADLPKRYVERQCNEWMKLGLQGTTTLVASGDYGVGGFPDDASVSGCLSGFGQNNTIFTPDFPVVCPYITAVGATQYYPDQTINDPESAMETDIAPHFSSGGGFSNYFPAPSYQLDAVDTYFKKHDPGYKYYTANADASNIGINGGRYNRAGRAYPDISANGATFRAYDDLTDYYWYGTSLAAPLWAAVITLINSERAEKGKGPVGFINPTLYANAAALTDIKNGSNPNCGSDGFPAVEGWDPSTGLGTPKYEDLLEVFMKLP